MKNEFLSGTNQAASMKRYSMIQPMLEVSGFMFISSIINETLSAKVGILYKSIQSMTMNRQSC